MVDSGINRSVDACRNHGKGGEGRTVPSKSVCPSRMGAGLGGRLTVP
jgi:hypothetical protein